MVCARVDMSKALQLAYTLHAKTLTKPLLAYNLTKPLTCSNAFFEIWYIFMISQDKPNTHHLDNTVMRRSPKYRQVPNKKCATFSKEPYDCVNYVELLNTTLIHMSWLTVSSSAQKQHTLESKKPLKGSYCRACSGITAKPPAVHRRPIFNPKSPLPKSCLKFVSLFPISCCLWWLV